MGEGGETSAAPAVLEGLAPETALVCRALLDLPLAVQRSVGELLSDDERDRADRFAFRRHRDRFIAGRAFLRLLLGRRLGQDPAALRFRYGPDGKPALADPRSDLRFNLSHAEGLAVCALATGCEIGVDVELVRPLPDAEGVARSCFTEGERAALAALPEEQRLRAFYETWTRKEALLKALGRGLAVPLDSFEVTLTSRAPGRSTGAADPFGVQHYSIHGFEPEPGYVGAVAVRGASGPPRHSHWAWGTSGSWGGES